MDTNNLNAQTNANPTENAPVVEKKINKKAIITVAAIVLAIVVIGLIWFFVNSSANKKADEAIALADTEMNDSIALDRYMEAAALGAKSGNRAKLEAAIRLYNKGEYQKAISYLEDASTGSDIVEAGKYTLLGDCYVNLENYDKALSCYDKAISTADNNPQIVPFVMVKKANIYRAQGKYAEEYDTYKTIFDKYPEYTNNLNFDIRKYAERARVASGK